MYQNWNILKKLSLIFALSIILLQLSVLATGAQSITGLSNFAISENSATIALNSSLAIPFNVILSHGTAGTTDLVIANGASLASNGIYVGMNPSSGTPSFSGTLYINTNVKQGVVPGTYTLEIESGGADPIYPGIFNLTLTVLNQASTSTVVQGSTTSYSVTSAPTTSTIQQQSTSPSSGGSSLLGDGAAVIIVILIIILLGYFIFRKKPATSKK